MGRLSNNRSSRELTAAPSVGVRRCEQPAPQLEEQLQWSQKAPRPVSHGHHWERTRGTWGPPENTSKAGGAPGKSWCGGVPAPFLTAPVTGSPSESPSRLAGPHQPPGRLPAPLTRPVREPLRWLCALCPEHRSQLSQASLPASSCVNTTAARGALSYLSCKASPPPRPSQFLLPFRSQPSTPTPKSPRPVPCSLVHNPSPPASLFHPGFQKQ